jgi:hypothetical protein
MSKLCPRSQRSRSLVSQTGVSQVSQYGGERRTSGRGNGVRGGGRAEPRAGPVVNRHGCVLSESEGGRLPAATRLDGRAVWLASGGAQTYVCVTHSRHCTARLDLDADGNAEQGFQQQALPRVFPVVLSALSTIWCQEITVVQ